MLFFVVVFLALYSILTGAELKGVILQKFGVCVYVLFSVNFCLDGFCRFLRICGLITCV